jgi:hypothetical protein
LSDASTERIDLTDDVSAGLAEVSSSKEPTATGWRADRDRLATQVAIGVVALGFLLIGAGWFGASGKSAIEQQFPYLLSGGLVGLALVFLGGGILVVRDVRRERDALEAQVSRLADVVETLVGAGMAPPDRGTKRAVTASGGLVVLGRTVFHTPDCRLVSGKHDLETAAREDALAEGLSPCRTCEP